MSRSMTKPLDTFWLDISLRHPSCEPESITAALNLKPLSASRSGSKIGAATRRFTHWMCKFREGIGDENFARSLTDVLLFFDALTGFFQQFSTSGGEVEFAINQVVKMDDGILFKLTLDHEFLKACGERQISLRVQAWSVEEELSD